MPTSHRRKAKKPASVRLTLTQLEGREAPAVGLVSAADPDFNPLGNGSSVTNGLGLTQFSADGRFQVFFSSATNLVAGDNNAQNDIFLRDRQTGAVERISVADDESEAGGGSFNASISADGRFVAFQSEASNLVIGDTNGERDVFVRDRTLGTTTRVSVDSMGNEATGGQSSNASISADGRFVAFQSFAANLVMNDTNGRFDIFVRDLTLGTTSRVNVDSMGNEATGGTGSFNASISADGRFVAFETTAANLVMNDNNGQFDIFVRDRQMGTTERVSIADDESDRGSFNASISADGRFVAFQSSATNLVMNDNNNRSDIFVRDRTLGTTTRVSVDSMGNEATGVGGVGSFNSSIAADGRFVVFMSSATNLVIGDTNSREDVFVRDLTGSTTTRANVDSAGMQANAGSIFAAISADGRFVAFQSDATNLVPGDTNGRADVFVRDLTANTTEASSRENFTGANGDSFAIAIAGRAGTGPRVSNDGRFVVFESDASNLVAGDTNSQRDVFVLDRQTGLVERVSVADDESQAAGGLSETATISADGRFVAFASTATNLVMGDSNNRRDIFVRDRMLGTTIRVSVDGMGNQADSDSFDPTISADGNVVAFESDATNLVMADDNGARDIFVRDLAGNTTTRISRDTMGGNPDGDSYTAGISPNGRFVVFSSLATDLVATDTNTTEDIFLFDRMTDTTALVTLSSAGLQGNGPSQGVSVSDDGRYVAFASEASNLVMGDDNDTTDIFVRDRQTMTTTAMSVDAMGNTVGGAVASISADGQFVAFQSAASNLVADDGNGVGDVFLRNRSSGTTSRLSVDGAGVEGNGDSLGASLSRAGNFAAFHSAATNLVPGDVNGRTDVFLDVPPPPQPPPGQTPTPPSPSPETGTGTGTATATGTGTGTGAAVDPLATINQLVIASLQSVLTQSLAPDSPVAIVLVEQIVDRNGDGYPEVVALVGLRVRVGNRAGFQFFRVVFDGLSPAGAVIPGGITRLGTFVP